MRISLAVALLAYAGAALAADVELASRIDRVSVYPDAAVVTRLAAVELPAGAATLILRALPAGIDPASIRVEGEASAGFSIGAVDVRAVPGEAKPVIDADIEARLRSLRDQRDAVAGRLAAAEGKKAAIERYAQASPEKLGPEARPLDIGQWASAWEAIGSGLAAVNEELRGLRARGRDLDGDIAALERARPQPPRPGAPKRDILIAVEAAAPLKGEIRVSYRVAGAGWLASYDARLDTGAKDRKPALTLARRAQVQQRTGEDWSGVALTVSTVRVNRGATAPDLPALIVHFYEPVPVPAPMAAAPRAAPPGRVGQLAETEAGITKEARGDERRRAEMQFATLEAGSFQASFAVPGRVTVPQDGSPKSFVLAERVIAPTLVVKAVPVLDETAYLDASFVNEDEAPLLPGEVSVHRDGTYVGRARLKLTATGDTVELGFGADDRVKVQRVPVRRRENEPGWIGQTKTDLREFKTTPSNLPAPPLRITIIDRIPVSENSAITVEPLRETTPATEKQVHDKRGVMAWSFDYGPGEQREIRLAYRLKWPADREIVYEGSRQ